MARMRCRARRLALLAALPALLLGSGVAGACMIDSKASLSANGVRASFIGLALVWGARELVNLVASAAGQTGLH